MINPIDDTTIELMMNTATAHDALTELTTIFTNAEIGEVLGVAPGDGFAHEEPRP